MALIEARAVGGCAGVVVGRAEEVRVLVESCIQPASLNVQATVVVCVSLSLLLRDTG